MWHRHCQKSTPAEDMAVDTQDREDRGEDLLRIATLVKQMPDADPPESLLSSVMGAVRVRKRPWWYRFYRWIRAPRSITFTPLQALSAAVIILAVLSVVTINGKPQMPRPGAGQELIPVKISVRIPDAKTVAVVGSFNDWHAQACSLHKEKETWTITMHLPSGRYEYAFVVDGQNFVPDPGAHIYQDDGFGNRNAVLIVGNHDEISI